MMILVGIGSTCGQGAIGLREIRERIAHRDSIMGECKKSVLIDSLVSQVRDYSLLAEGLQKENDSYAEENEIFRKQLHHFMILTSNDTIVFCQNIKEIDNIPDCLKEHADLICRITELRTMIGLSENKAHALEQQLGNSSVAYAAIFEKIEPELKKILDLINRIKGMTLSSLSEKQRAYLLRLVERYNNFEKYF